MSFANRGALVAEIATWLNRDDLTSAIPSFITLAEEELNATLRVREMLVRDVVVTPSADEPYENLPADFLALKSIRFNTDPVVRPDPVTPERIEDLRRQWAGAGGTPLYYAIVGNQILFERTPTGSPEMDLQSYVTIPALTADEDENAILARYPTLYLYGALKHSAPYLKDDPRIALWDSVFQKALERANLASDRAEMSPGPLVMRPKRAIG